MDNESKNKIKTQDYILIKELLVGKDRFYIYQLAGIQNGIIDFCKNINMFQKSESFFSLTISGQFEFNECIDYVGNRIKKDFKDLEIFYSECKEKCLDIYSYNREEMLEGIEKHLDSMTNFFRPNIHPCIADCVGLYHYTTQNYYNYMVRDYGIYTEYIDYKKKVEL